jgi:hypothetical protein
MNIQDITAIKTLSGFYFEITTEKSRKKRDTRRDKSDRFLTSGQTLSEAELKECLKAFFAHSYNAAKEAVAIWDRVQLAEQAFNERFSYYTGITLKGRPATFTDLETMYLKAIERAQFKQASLF